MFERARILGTSASAVVLVVLTAGCSEFPSAESSPDERRSENPQAEPGDGRSGSARPVQAAVNESAPQAKSRASNWPRFRGPNGAGASRETGLPTRWSATENIIWRRKLPGPGSSSPIVWENRVYVTCFTGYGLSPQSPGDKSDLKRHLLCIHRDTGRVLWSKTIDGGGIVHPGTTHEGIRSHGFATHTPTADETGVYAFFGPSGVFAYSHSGTLRWKKSCGTKTADYGSCISPVLYRDLLLVYAAVECGSLIAFDKRTGVEKWRRGKSRQAGTSATPAVITLNGKPQLVYCSGPNGQVAGLDPLRGTKLWETSVGISRINVAPVAIGNLLFFTGSPVARSSVIQVTGGGDVKPLWKKPRGSYISSPLAFDGHFLWVTQGGGVVTCVDAKTGDVRYQKRLQPDSGDVYASPVTADGKIYIVSRNRGAFVLKAGIEFKQLAHNTIAGDTSLFHGTPAIGGGRLFLRSNESLYCIGRK